MFIYNARNMTGRRKVLLLQLPIPPLGSQAIRGNIPLAAGYLSLYARRCGLDQWYDIEILPASLTNHLGDVALVEAILSRQPWLVGFTCYLWNVERSLWLAERLKLLEPDLRVLVGGPEITLDNAWVLQHPAVDYAVIGEGEGTFVELLAHLAHQREVHRPIPGLVVNRNSCGTQSGFLPRSPLPSLDLVASPYVEGILDPAEDRMLLLETLRGCVFKCKFCYYPKSYDRLYFLSLESLRAILRVARQKGVQEVVLLDPTLNQRRDLADLLRLLAEANPDGQWKCFGELRAEGITDELAQLLRQANFTEVEVGLQSVEPRTMRLMDRNNNLRAFERGVAALRRAGIRVIVDLIIGLPGDTPDSVRRSMEYLKRSGMYDDVQVFHLMVLPGTDFRREAELLGLKFQSRPPYYVTRTAQLELTEMFRLWEDATAIFELQWDDLPDAKLPPALLASRPEQPGTLVVSPHQPADWAAFYLPLPDHLAWPPQVTQVFTLWLRSQDPARDTPDACHCIKRLLQHNPFLTLTVILEPINGATTGLGHALQRIWATCLEQPSYLDRYYSVQPGSAGGAKRLIVCLPRDRGFVNEGELAEIEELAEILYLEDCQPAEGDVLCGR
jgi:radical SAM superfamily enzyme YgiQ (UPF0313 family)